MLLDKKDRKVIDNKLINDYRLSYKYIEFGFFSFFSHTAYWTYALITLFLSITMLFIFFNY